MPKIEFPFLPVHLHTPNHPKILKFKRRHGPGSWHDIIGLWLWAALYRPNGDLSGMEDEEIEAVAEWRGTAGSMVQSMIDCALLDGERGFLRIHDWDEWQQHFVVAWTRAQTARRVRNLRGRRSVTGNAVKRSGNAKVTPRGEERRGDQRREEKTLDQPSVDRVSVEPDGFSRFWSIYPKRVGKGAARKAWTKIRPSNGTIDAILKAVEVQKGWPAWTKDGGQFIPHPATWLNQSRWEDEGEPTKTFDLDRFARIPR